MNWFSVKSLSIIACTAFMFTTIASNRLCAMHYYQEKLPESAKKLRKF